MHPSVSTPALPWDDTGTGGRTTKAPGELTIREYHYALPPKKLSTLGKGKEVLAQQSSGMSSAPSSSSSSSNA
ncbi:hypothetical protein H0H92_003855 [Tricholoma furcatifolium]|nr:hypothetical protein H0H92_003855 [Tricholoma furcatifolium]